MTSVEFEPTIFSLLVQSVNLTANSTYMADNKNRTSFSIRFRRLGVLYTGSTFDAGMQRN